MILVIVYNDILEKLKAAGYSTYRLRKESLLSEHTISHIRTGAPISTASVNIICRLTGLTPGDLLSYVPDDC